MNQSSNYTLFAKYILELPLALFLLTFLYQLTLTQLSTLFNLHLHFSLHMDTLITLLHLKTFHFQTHNPKHAACWWLFFFLSVISRFTILSQIFSKLFPKIMHNVSTEYLLMRTWPLSARVLILSPQYTCTEVILHLKPHCSYREAQQYQRTAAHYHRRYTVHRTHCECAQQ